MIAIVDYNTGNILSVANALRRLGAEFILTGDPAEIGSADRVILPGVGHAAVAMANLRGKRLDEAIRRLTRPVLGICIGTQLMCSHSEEGDTPCIGIFDNKVTRFSAAETDEKGNKIKIPHMGWNTISQLRTPLFNGIGENSYIYYVHSYSPCISGSTAAQTFYGRPFSGALNRDNFYGCQFHPEKSGKTGEQILKNFLTL